jgi:NADH dehydrogenase
LPERLADAAKAELETLGVSVRTGVRVIEAVPHALVTDDGERIDADLIVWAAGVKGAPRLGTLGLETNPNNQIVVRETLQTTRDERIFAIGDCCSFTPSGSTRPVPPRAQAAHQMATSVYRNLVRLQSGRQLRPFVYHDHGSLVSLSRYSTVGSLMGNLIGGRMAIEGRLARLVYKSLYRMHLIAIHGYLKGIVLLLLGRVNRIIRPRLKLH